MALFTPASVACADKNHRDQQRVRVHMLKLGLGIGHGGRELGENLVHLRRGKRGRGGLRFLWLCIAGHGLGLLPCRGLGGLVHRCTVF